MIVITVLLIVILIIIMVWFLNNRKNIDCKVTGCSGQICSEKDIPTTCEYRCEYSCFKKANCKKINGKCGWETGAEFYKCLDECNKQRQQIIDNMDII